MSFPARPEPTFGSTRLKTSSVAATANTPSLKASARVFLTKKTLLRGERRVRLALAPETPGFLAVPARGHRAPATGVVLRPIVEGPSTRLRAAHLEPPPVLTFHRRVHRRDDAAHRGHDPGCLGLELWLSVRSEAHPKAARGRGL